uniref:Uncharacterized protein n=1 Tax=Podarcis muralis TaxID=64176 RepID=A0A670J3A5_PODMU
MGLFPSLAASILFKSNNVLAFQLPAVATSLCLMIGAAQVGGKTPSSGMHLLKRKEIYKRGGSSCLSAALRVSSPLITVFSHQAYNCNNTYVDGQLYHTPFGDSTGSLHSTVRSGKSQHSYIPFVLREESGLNNSQVHIGPPDPSSLFLEAKDPSNGKEKRTGQILSKTAELYESVFKNSL